jgi:Fe-S-cluster containining protein
MNYSARHLKSGFNIYNFAGRMNSNQLSRWKKLPGHVVDKTFHTAHEEVFAITDCLNCANCCKTTGPLFTQKDIEHIARNLKMTPGNFQEKYLRRDEDGDLVLKSVPCTFLLADNRCSIYEFRPKACREYPHTDRKNMKEILNLTKKNASVCPAVENILKQVSKTLK